MMRTLLKDKKLTTVRAFRDRYKNAELLKYSPEKRCLFLVREEENDYFVKMYPKKFLRNDRGFKMHMLGQVMWELSQNQTLDFRVPRPLQWDSETRTIWQERLSGRPAIDVLKEAKAESLSLQIGKLIAQIADTDIAPHRIFDRDEQLKDSIEHKDRINAKCPGLKKTTEKLIELFADLHKTIPVRRMVPTHGDLHIDQILFDGEKLGLLDFEDFALAEPERELAFFAVQIETEHGKEVRWPLIVRCLLAGYRAAGKRIHRRGFYLYKAHKYFSKAAKAKDERSALSLLSKANRSLEACRG